MKLDPMSMFFQRSFLLKINSTLLVILLAFVTATADQGAELERPTTEGPVVGVADEATGTVFWKAIPYAKPPVGELRWKAPVRPEKRSQPLKTDSFCQLCPQYIDHDNNDKTLQVTTGDEDCLYLNIWTPENAGDGADLPVFFWIHGGGNSIQWPRLSDLNGGFLAKRGNMVVVSISYRLGPMGFLTHPALKTGNKEEDSGNFTILDQIAALKWVQDNIKAFGGNPDNVIIAGQSAGGQAVFNLIVSPLAKGLFHRAISQSGVIRPSTPDEGTAHANQLLARLLVQDGTAKDEKSAEAKLATMSNKEIAQYLRSKKASELLAGYPDGPAVGMYFFPNSFEDGYVLPEDVDAALSSGNYNKVPMILGSNKDEVKIFIRLYQPFVTWRADGSLFKDLAKGDLYNKTAVYLSDGWKAMGVDGPARIMSSHKDQPPVYAYQFIWGEGGFKKSVLPPPIDLILGVSHCLEIDFVFGTENASLGIYAFTSKNKPGREALSHAIMDYWTAFARTGDPNPRGAGLTKWKAWTNKWGKWGAKSLLLDADFDKTRIRMSNIEFTTETIEAELKKDPLQPEIQPYWDNSIFKKK